MNYFDFHSMLLRRISRKFRIYYLIPKYYFILSIKIPLHNNLNALF